MSIVQCLYLLNGEKVTPTDGDIILQWSYDGVTWEEFSGGVYRLPNGPSGGGVNASMRYVRAIGSLTGADSLLLTLRFDNDGLHIPQTSQTSNRYFSAVNTVQISGFQHSILQGNAIALSTEITVPANTVYSIKLVKNADTVVTFVYASELLISYMDGDVTGDLVELVGGGRLNTLEDFQFQSGAEFYDGPATGVRLVTDRDKLDVLFVVNGGGVIELINDTDSDITTYFSIGEVAVTRPIVPYILTPDTELTANTEMSDYNGAN